MHDVAFQNEGYCFHSPMWVRPKRKPLISLWISLKSVMIQENEGINLPERLGRHRTIGNQISDWAVFCFMDFFYRSHSLFMSIHLKSYALKKFPVRIKLKINVVFCLTQGWYVAGRLLRLRYPPWVKIHREHD